VLLPTALHLAHAHHLARTALRVLSDCAPDYTPRAVPNAVALAEGGDPAALRAASAV